MRVPPHRFWVQLDREFQSESELVATRSQHRPSQVGVLVVAIGGDNFPRRQQNLQRERVFRADPIKGGQEPVVPPTQGEAGHADVRTQRPHGHVPRVPQRMVYIIPEHPGPDRHGRPAKIQCNGIEEPGVDHHSVGGSFAIPTMPPTHHHERTPALFGQENGGGSLHVRAWHKNYLWAAFALECPWGSEVHVVGIARGQHAPSRHLKLRSVIGNRLVVKWHGGAEAAKQLQQYAQTNHNTSEHHFSLLYFDTHSCPSPV